MDTLSLNADINYISGIGSKKAELLKKHLHIHTVEHLLEHFPFRYIDKSILTPIASINVSNNSLIKTKGIIKSVSTTGNYNKKRLTAVLTDGSKEIELVWFRSISWIAKLIVIGKPFVVFGSPSIFNKKVSFVHPEIEAEEKHKINPSNSIESMYHSTELLTKSGLNSRGLQRVIQNVLTKQSLDIPETLPSYIINKYQFPSKKEAIYNIHLPKSIKTLNWYKERLVFEELFYTQLRMLYKKQANQASKGFIFEAKTQNVTVFCKEYLPFKLTNAQKRVLKEIKHDLDTGSQMNRLLQGDVGSGKTIVATIAMLMAVDSSFQACIMAPTEILAKQHFQSINKSLDALNINCALLTGSTKKTERNLIAKGLESGDIHIIIGTHALLEEPVRFKNLGLAVIDEQHRFGVKQRAKLWKKNILPPHILLMSATPIPRTLAMTIYGDLDISIIDELPPGRKPVTTIHLKEGEQLKSFKYVEDAIEKGHQAYFIFPLIEESKHLSYKYLEDGYTYISQRFPKPKYQICFAHGNMKPEDKDQEVERFVNNQCQIMIATTVIEVGVNVPNATVMVIESAERFGLSQLHQLRGRVGRGSDQSHCILITGNKLSHEGKTRMQTMTQTNDGFKIAEVDLKLRGPGDILGTQQSGLLNFKIANPYHDTLILELSRKAVIAILKKDPLLNNTHNSILKQQLTILSKKEDQWDKIS